MRRGQGGKGRGREKERERGREGERELAMSENEEKNETIVKHRILRPKLSLIKVVIPQCVVSVLGGQPSPAQTSSSRAKIKSEQVMKIYPAKR